MNKGVQRPDLFVRLIWILKNHPPLVQTNAGVTPQKVEKQRGDFIVTFISKLERQKVIASLHGQSLQPGGDLSLSTFIRKLNLNEINEFLFGKPQR